MKKGLNLYWALWNRINRIWQGIPNTRVITMIFFFPFFFFVSSFCCLTFSFSFSPSTLCFNPIVPSFHFFFLNAHVHQVSIASILSSLFFFLSFFFNYHNNEDEDDDEDFLFSVFFDEDNADDDNKENFHFSMMMRMMPTMKFDRKNR